TMGVQMPDMDGIEATRRIVSDAEITASVGIVTTFDHDDYLFRALDAGAGGFLLKNAGPEELITAVRALAAGDGILAPEVTRRVLARFAGAGKSNGPSWVAEPVEAPRPTGHGPSTSSGTQKHAPHSNWVAEPVEAPRP